MKEERGGGGAAIVFSIWKHVQLGWTDWIRPRNTAASSQIVAKVFSLIPLQRSAKRVARNPTELYTIDYFGKKVIKIIEIVTFFVI